MQILIFQFQFKENLYTSKLKEMQIHPLSHQPSEILSDYRRLSLKEAANELKALESERGRTPLQKLICLKKTFVVLESYLLEMTPPTKLAPNPPIKDPQFKTATITSKRQRTITEKEHSVPEYRRIAHEQWKVRKQHVMQLVLLLLIYHSPENLFAHLEYISFHTINDEKYSSLCLYHTIFRSSMQQLMDTVPKKKTRRNTLKLPQVSYHTYIWGFVGDEVETYPTLCDSLENKQVLSIKCGDKHMIALTSKCKFKYFVKSFFFVFLQFSLFFNKYKIMYII